MKIFIVSLSFLIALTAPRAAIAAGYQAADEEDSLIIIDGLSGMFDHTQFLNKDWDEGYRRRGYYFGNNKTLGINNRIGIWLSELSPGRHYPSSQEVRELPDKFRLFKERGNVIQSTGTVASSFGQADYVTFRSTQVPCAIFTSTFGAKSAHMGTEAGTMRLNGYVCLKTGDAVTAEFLERILLSVGVRGISKPKPFGPGTDRPEMLKPLPQPPSTVAPITNGGSSVGRLGELKQLLDKGLITQDDYARKKKEILDSL